MTKKKKVLTAGAAFAVAAAALTPVASVDAAQKRVIELAPMTFTGGEVKLPAKVGSSKITWYKSGIDMKKVNTWQTIKGYAGTKKVPTTIKIKIANYVVGFQQSVAPQEVEVDGKLVLPAKLKANFAVGAYFVDVKWEDAKTDKAGDYEVKGTYTRDGKTITVVAKYSVVDADLKIENVSSSVDQAAEVLSVNADVKNLKDGEKVELVVFAGRDMNAPLPAVQAEVKEGKLTVKSAKLPAGNHSFILRSGEVKTDAVNFTVDAPMVKEVKAINGTQLLVKFNKALNQATAQTPGNYMVNGSAVPGGASTTYELQDDKMSVLITMPVANKFANNSSFLVTVNGVKTVDAKDVAKFSEAVTFADTVAPTLGAVSYPSNTTAKVAFSEGMKQLPGNAIKIYDGNTEVTGTGLQSVNGIAADGDKEIVIDLANAEVNKVYTVKVFGALDLYGNFAGTQTFTVTRTNADTVKPTVESVESLSLNTFKINFSERVSADTVAANGYGDFKVGSFTGKLLTGSTGVTTVTPSADGKSLTVVLAANATPGLNAVEVNNFFDASGNKQTSAFVKVINFAADTKAPEVVKTEVIGNMLYVTYDDNDITAGTVTPALINVKRVNNNIEYPVTSFGTVALHDADGDGKSNTIKISLANQADGVYSATLEAGVASDKASTPNATVAKAISFTYNAAASTEKPKVSDDNNVTNGITNGYTAQSAANPNEIVLTFDKAVSAATALNVNNYLVDGAQVFEKAIFVGDDKTVRLTLKQDAINVTATRAFTIQNVASTAGVYMDTITFAQPFVENVAPTLKSARLLAADKIEVKFTEALTDTTLTAGSVKDLEVYVGGVKREEIPAASVSGSGDTYVITLQSGNALTAEDLAKDIQVKLLGTTDVKDASSIRNAAKGNVSISVAK